MKYVFNETTHQEFLSSLKTENDVMISSSDFFFHTEYDLSFLSFFLFKRKKQDNIGHRENALCTQGHNPADKKWIDL